MHLFEKAGESNTERTLGLAIARAAELGIHTFIVATTSGRTGLMAARMLEGRTLVVVTHSTGFDRPGVQEADPAVLGEIRELGASILTTTHAFGGVGRAIRRRFKTYQVEEIIAQTLRLFGQGTKVAIEMALMAADAGLVQVDRDVISIGGTASGADTALVLRPAHAQDFFSLRVREIVCKPG
jgi:hypothetical protein